MTLSETQTLGENVSHCPAPGLGLSRRLIGNGSLDIHEFITALCEQPPDIVHSDFVQRCQSDVRLLQLVPLVGALNCYCLGIH